MTVFPCLGTPWDWNWKLRFVVDPCETLTRLDTYRPEAAHLCSAFLKQSSFYSLSSSALIVRYVCQHALNFASEAIEIQQMFGSFCQFKYIYLLQVNEWKVSLLFFVHFWEILFVLLGTLLGFVKKKTTVSYVKSWAHYCVRVSNKPQMLFLRAFVCHHNPTMEVLLVVFSHHVFLEIS